MKILPNKTTQKGFTTTSLLRISLHDRSLHSRGFTLIELLVVISVIAALGVAVFVALDPARRLLDARNARRTTDVDQMLSAIHTSTVDSKGTLPTGLIEDMAETQIGTSDGISPNPSCAIAIGGCSVTATACVNLTTPLVKYLKTIPVDPSGGTTYTAAKSGYSVEVDTNGLVTVRACGAETPTGDPAVTISASR